MNNNDESKKNTEGKSSLLNYSGETSYTNLSGPVSQPESLATPETSEPSLVQFESRRARRASETSMIKQTPIPRKTPSLIPAVPATKTPKTEPAAEPVEEASKVAEIFEVPATTETIPPATTASVTTGDFLKEKLEEHHPKNNKAAIQRSPKDYWGGTAMLTSLSIFLVAQLIFAVILVGYIVFDGLLSEIQQGTKTMEEIILGVPLLLIVSSIMMYAAWLSCMWWVTKYRSGVQQGKKFWKAFKENFRLDVFKKRDIAYGAGIAGVMFGLQHLVLNVLPQQFPSLKPFLEGADNTGAFASMDGISFWIISFGLGALLGPICEELFFRGFLLRGFENHYSYKNSGRNMDVLEDGLAEQAIGLKSMFISYRSFTHKYRYILAIILTSVLFGLMHFNGSWVTCIMTGLLGLSFAIVTIKLNRLYPAIFGHIFHNAIVFFIVGSQQ